MRRAGCVLIVSGDEDGPSSARRTSDGREWRRWDGETVIFLPDNNRAEEDLR